MKTVPKIGIKSAIFNITRKKPNFSQVIHTLDKSTTSFNTLLTNKIKSLGSKKDFPDANSPMERGDLIRLIEMVQIQLNKHLFHAFADPDEGDKPNGFHVDWINFQKIAVQMESLVSESQHARAHTNGVHSRADIDGIIDHASKRYDVDPDLTKALIRAESDFDVNCTSSKGAMGLMQLMPETAKELGVKNSYDPVENVMGGTRYLKNLLDRYDNNVSLALAAYNWGMGNLERNPGKLPRETRTYITRVHRYYQELKS